MQPYPGLPRPSIGALLTHEQSRPRYDHKAEFYLGRVNMPCNVGTYLDSPFHRYAGAADLSQLPLEKLAGLPGIVLDGVLGAGAGRAVGIEAEAAELAGCAVLVRTGWDQRWGDDRYWEPGPFLSPDATDLLVEAGPVLVGVDFWNVDNTEDPVRPAHTRLLGAGILIVENLTNLSEVPRTGFRFTAVSLAIRRGASFPVRAYAEV